MKRIALIAIAALILLGCERRQDLNPIGLPLTEKTYNPDYTDATCERCHKIFALHPIQIKERGGVICPYCGCDQKLRPAIDRFNSYPEKHAKIEAQLQARLLKQQQAQFQAQQKAQEQYDSFSEFVRNRQNTESQQPQPSQDAPKSNSTSQQP
jgi:hypothetical protein